MRDTHTQRHRKREREIQRPVRDREGERKIQGGWGWGIDHPVRETRETEVHRPVRKRRGLMRGAVGMRGAVSNLWLVGGLGAFDWCRQAGGPNAT